MDAALKRDIEELIKRYEPPAPYAHHGLNISSFWLAARLKLLLELAISVEKERDDMALYIARHHVKDN